MFCLPPQNLQFVRIAAGFDRYDLRPLSSRRDTSDFQVRKQITTSGFKTWLTITVNGNSRPDNAGEKFPKKPNIFPLPMSQPHAIAVSRDAALPKRAKRGMVLRAVAWWVGSDGELYSEGV